MQNNINELFLQLVIVIRYIVIYNNPFSQKYLRQASVCACWLSRGRPPAIHGHLRYDERATQELPKSPAYSLPIAESGGERRKVEGLIIKRTKTIGEYRRVGLFYLRGQEGIDKYLDAMKQQRLDTEDFENVEDINGDHRYIICLV